MEPAQPTGGAPPPATTMERVSRGTAVVERAAEELGDFVWRRLKRRPYLGVALAAAAGLTLASWVGVGELALGAFAGYAAYKVLLQHEPPSRAVRDALELRKEIDV